MLRRAFFFVANSLPEKTPEIQRRSVAAPCLAYEFDNERKMLREK